MYRIIHSNFTTIGVRIKSWTGIVKLVNYSRSSYPIIASYSGQVDGFRNSVKNELKTTALFEIISNTNANFLNLHIDKSRKTRDNKQLYLITHITRQTLNLNYLPLTLNVTVEFKLRSNGIPWCISFRFMLSLRTWRHHLFHTVVMMKLWRAFTLVWIPWLLLLSVAMFTSF